MFLCKKKKPPAGLHHTEDRAGDAPNPHFQSKPPISNSNLSKHRIIDFLRLAAEAAACKFHVFPTPSLTSHPRPGGWRCRPGAQIEPLDSMVLFQVRLLPLGFPMFPCFPIFPVSPSPPPFLIPPFPNFLFPQFPILPIFHPNLKVPMVTGPPIDSMHGGQHEPEALKFYVFPTPSLTSNLRPGGWRCMPGAQIELYILIKAQPAPATGARSSYTPANKKLDFSDFVSIPTGFD